MAHPKARLYQRLRSKGFPWVLVEFHKNGSPKPRAEAFQFGVRYSVEGKRKLDPAATLDEALVILKDRNVRLYALAGRFPFRVQNTRSFIILFHWLDAEWPFQGRQRSQALRYSGHQHGTRGAAQNATHLRLSKSEGRSGVPRKVFDSTFPVVLSRVEIVVMLRTTETFTVSFEPK
jgi:hypothetical protein